MTAVSLKQPWAYFVIEGYADEFNGPHSWRNLSGPVLLYALPGFDELWHTKLPRAIAHAAQEHLRELFIGRMGAPLPKHAVVGALAIQYNREPHSSAWAQPNRNRYAVAAVKKLKRPFHIKPKGQLFTIHFANHQMPSTVHHAFTNVSRAWKNQN